MKPLAIHTLAPRGLTVVEASAGTGKTHAIGTLVLRALLEWGYTLDQLLVATFTNAAAAELRGKLRARLKEALGALEGTAATTDPIVAEIAKRLTDKHTALARLRAALRDFDEASISTLHGFAARLLSEHAFDTGNPYDVELTGGGMATVEELVDEALVRAMAEAQGPWAHHLAQMVSGKGGLRGRLVKASAERVRDPALVLELLVEAPSAAEVARAGDAVEAAVSALLHVWPKTRAPLEKLVVGNEALHGKKFQAKTMLRVLDSVEAFVSAPRVPHTPVPDVFARLAQSKLVAETNKGKVTPTHPVFEAAEALSEAAKALAAMLESATHAFVCEVASFVGDELPRRLAARGLSSFDELVHALGRAVAGPRVAALRKVVRARYPVVLIDEFQDTDAEQHQVFEQLFVADEPGAQPSALFLIGDPKQSIYRFRGADVHAYLRAREAAGAAVYSMTTNWRSDPRVLAGLNGLYAGAPQAFGNTPIAYHPVEPRPGAADVLARGDKPASGVELCWVPRGPAQTVSKKGGATALSKVDARALVTGATASLVAGLLDGSWTIGQGQGGEARAVGAHDLAVLVHNGHQGRAILRALARRGLAAVLQASSSVFATIEAEEVLTLLEALVEPHRTRRVETALATELGGMSAAELVALRASDRALDVKLSAFHVAGKLLATDGPLAAFAELARTLELEPRLLGRQGGERQLTNYWHLAELLHEQFATAHAGPEALARWLTRQVDGGGADEPAATEAAQLRLESDERAIRVVTIHGSKGLEYPVVLLPFLWDERKPKPIVDARYHRDGVQVLAIGADDDAQERAREEEREESARLTYVALTRAKHRCVVFWGGFSGFIDSPMGALLHPGDEDARAKVAASTDDELWQTLAARAKSIDALELTRFDAQRAKAVAPVPPVVSPTFAARPFTRTLDRAFRLTSFSGLVGEGREHETHGVYLGAADEGSGVGLSIDGGAASSGSSGTASLLAQFPRGRLAGSALHGVFEKLDFGAYAQRGSVLSGGDDDLVRRELRRYGVAEASAAQALGVALPHLLRAELLAGRPGLALAQLATHERLPELAFMLAHEGNTLTPRALASLLRKYERATWVTAYADRIERLGFAPLCGFVQGFVDLVFRHDGRFYVLDYKSNDLGGTVEDYGDDALAHAMMDHHYPLQALLYAAGLHRYLQVRVPGYRYADHLGGALYLFMRGMAPQPRPGHGVFAWRPSEALLVAMGDAVVTAGEAA